MMGNGEMRDDVSIFFNFTTTVFEKADPLMGLVNVGKPLLFYDRLSVGSFLKSQEEREDYIEGLLFDMRNLLESRSLSQKDRNGRIRLIVAIDLSNGICPPSQNQMKKKCFPAQNARYFKQKVKQVFAEGTFDEKNHLVDRFRYCFIFVDGSSDEQSLSRLYRESAYTGYSNLLESDWITADMFGSFDKKAKQLVTDKFGGFLPNLSIGDKSVSPQFSELVQEIDNMVDDSNWSFSKYMTEVGLLEEFRDLFMERLARLKTVEEIRSFKFKDEILSVVTSLLGFGSESFMDSTFFLLRVNNSTDVEKCKGEVYLKSLIQMIASMDDESYRGRLLAQALNTPWYFFLDIANAPKSEDCYNKEAFAMLCCYADKCQKSMDDLRWPKGTTLSYQYFESNTQDTRITDSHNRLNDKLEKVRTKKQEMFLNTRKIPFFFGQKPGDWSWYDDVIANVEDIYKFERENERPLYDVPKRITDSEMKVTTKQSTYAELEVEMNRIKGEGDGKIPMEDYKGYQEKRHEMMMEFAKAIDDLKVEMVKLGFLSRLLWISILSSLAFTLGFAFHFFYNGFEDKPMWIAVGFVAVVLLFLLGAIIARSSVKSKINSAYSKIDLICEELRKRLDGFLREVGNRVKLQNEADIRKRNLDEMEKKMNEFYSHNKQVEIWEDFYKGIAEKIQRLTRDVNCAPQADEDAMTFLDGNFSLSMPPSLPYKVRSRFDSMQTGIGEATVNNVTCFIKKFKFSRWPR